MHPNYWGYVAAGYVLTFGTVGAYTLWLRRRLAAARTSLPAEGGASLPAEGGASLPAEERP
jgi:hypothetical protein